MDKGSQNISVEGKQGGKAQSTGTSHTYTESPFPDKDGMSPLYSEPKTTGGDSHASEAGIVEGSPSYHPKDVNAMGPEGIQDMKPKGVSNMPPDVNKMDKGSMEMKNMHDRTKSKGVKY